MLARLSLCLLVAMPSAAFAETAEQALARTRAMLADPCERPGSGEPKSDEIVVCARKSQGEAYRVPPEENGEIFNSRARRGEVPNASADRLNAKGCGIFEGERRCGRKEMQLYGYFGGRDPLSVLTKLVTVMADPDADVAPPPALPKRR